MYICNVDQYQYWPFNQSSWSTYAAGNITLIITNTFVFDIDLYQQDVDKFYIFIKAKRLKIIVIDYIFTTLITADIEL